MLNLKDTERSCVDLSFDAKVIKTYRGHRSRERLENEVRVLRYLELQGCTFVPRLLEVNRDVLQLVLSQCGNPVQQISQDRLRELFEELASYGVRHDDPELRNVTYRASDGRFCVVDFEFATIEGSASQLESSAFAEIEILDRLIATEIDT